MEWLTTVLSAQAVASWETWLEDWGSLVFLGLFGLELLRLAIKRRMSWNLAGDSLASFLTFGFFIVFTYGLIGAAYVSIFYWAYLNFAIMDIPVTPVTVLLLVVLCDLAYYWEHRFTHRVGLAWATHSVHHSSPYFNISVAYRFGPMDGVWPIFFHLPLAVAGFDPILIFACEAFVQLYQTILHTEVIGKLPRPVEAIMNTPSHHRVHHGTNAPYIDRNYGGIFIIWDKLFGTFAEEREPVEYGLTEQIDSVNPLTVWFHGIVRLLRRSLDSGSYREAAFALVAPPEWKPGDKQRGPQRWLFPGSAVAALVIALGIYPGVADELSESSAALASGGKAAAVIDDPERQATLRSVAERYYRNYIAEETTAAYQQFASDALLHYKMDFGSYYGTAEFAFRADDPEGFDESLFEGYEPLEARYEIIAVHATESGGVIHAVYTEAYRWEGYTGEMKAEERLEVELQAEHASVVRFRSEQVYR